MDLFFFLSTELKKLQLFSEVKIPRKYRHKNIKPHKDLLQYQVIRFDSFISPKTCGWKPHIFNPLTPSGNLYWPLHLCAISAYNLFNVTQRFLYPCKVTKTLLRQTWAERKNLANSANLAIFHSHCQNPALNLDLDINLARQKSFQHISRYQHLRK